MDKTWQRNLALFRSSSPDSKENQEIKDTKGRRGDREESAPREKSVKLGLKDRKASWDVMEK